MPTRRRPTCTGAAASWCPIHGDCSCPPRPEGEQGAGERTLTDPGCPLHAPTSDHAASVVPGSRANPA